MSKVVPAIALACLSLLGGSSVVLAQAGTDEEPSPLLRSQDNFVYDLRRWTPTEPKNNATAHFLHHSDQPELWEKLPDCGDSNSPCPLTPEGGIQRLPATYLDTMQAAIERFDATHPAVDIVVVVKGTTSKVAETSVNAGVAKARAAVGANWLVMRLVAARILEDGRRLGDPLSAKAAKAAFDALNADTRRLLETLELKPTQRRGRRTHCLRRRNRSSHVCILRFGLKPPDSETTRGRDETESEYHGQRRLEVEASLISPAFPVPGPGTGMEFVPDATRGAKTAVDAVLSRPRKDYPLPVVSHEPGAYKERGRNYPDWSLAHQWSVRCLNRIPKKGIPDRCTTPDGLYASLWTYERPPGTPGWLAATRLPVPTTPAADQPADDRLRGPLPLPAVGKRMLPLVEACESAGVRRADLVPEVVRLTKAAAGWSLGGDARMGTARAVSADSKTLAGPLPVDWIYLRRREAPHKSFMESARKTVRSFCAEAASLYGAGRVFVSIESTPQLADSRTTAIAAVLWLAPASLRDIRYDGDCVDLPAQDDELAAVARLDVEAHVQFSRNAATSPWPAVEACWAPQTDLSRARCVDAMLMQKSEAGATEWSGPAQARFILPETKCRDLAGRLLWRLRYPSASPDQHLRAVLHPIFSVDLAAGLLRQLTLPPVAGPPPEDQASLFGLLAEPASSAPPRVFADKRDFDGAGTVGNLKSAAADELIALGTAGREGSRGALYREFPELLPCAAKGDSVAVAATASRRSGMNPPRDAAFAVRLKAPGGCAEWSAARTDRLVRELVRSLRAKKGARRSADLHQRLTRALHGPEKLPTDLRQLEIELTGRLDLAASGERSTGPGLNVVQRLLERHLWRSKIKTVRRDGRATKEGTLYRVPVKLTLTKGSTRGALYFVKAGRQWEWVPVIRCVKLGGLADIVRGFPKLLVAALEAAGRLDRSGQWTFCFAGLPSPREK